MGAEAEHGDTHTLTLTVKVKGSEYTLAGDPSSSAADLVRQLSETAGLREDTVAILCCGKRYSINDSSTSSPELCQRARGKPLLACGSSAADVERVKQHRELRIRGFRDEQKRSALRSSKPKSNSQHAGPPSDVFGELRPIQREGWPDSRSFLRRLACRLSVVKCMRNHGLSVGVLAEMPPTDGCVGVDDACKLGFNRGAGAEIQLRLVTDDGASLRKERSVIQVLAHELAHNVHSEHNNAFKELNSTILKEIDAHDAAEASQSQHFAGLGEAADFAPEYEEDAAFASSSGQSEPPVESNAKEAVRDATLRRLGQK